MTLIKPTHFRKGKTITYPDGSKKGFDFINEAKRESHKIQMAENSALGRGVLQVR